MEKEKLLLLNHLVLLLKRLDGLREQLLLCESKEQKKRLVLQYKNLSKRISLLFNKIDFNIEELDELLTILNNNTNEQYESIIEDQINMPNMNLVLRKLILMVELRDQEIRPLEIDVQGNYIGAALNPQLVEDAKETYKITQNLYNNCFKDEIIQYLIQCDKIINETKDPAIKSAFTRIKYDLIYIYSPLEDIIVGSSYEMQNQYLSYAEAFIISSPLEYDNYSMAKDSLNASIAINDIKEILEITDIMALDQETYIKMLKYYANLLASLIVLSTDTITEVYTAYDEMAMKLDKNAYGTAINLIDKAMITSQKEESHTLSLNIERSHLQ